MVFFNYATMQMAAKIVYYGPGLCGKTTNLHHIYAKTSPQSRGEMVSLETETDRTLFFDLLPIDVGVIGGFKTRLQLYTIPGQVFYNTTRKLVLKGVDGIVFVADSQQAALDGNVGSLKNLRENLAEIGINLDDIPLVIQLNKRDLPNVASIETLLDMLDPDRNYEYVEAVASTGTGVFETLKVISKLTLRTLRRRMTGEEPVKHGPAQARRRRAVPREERRRNPARNATATHIDIRDRHGGAGVSERRRSTVDVALVADRSRRHRRGSQCLRRARGGNPRATAARTAGRRRAGDQFQRSGEAGESRACEAREGPLHDRCHGRTGGFAQASDNADRAQSEERTSCPCAHTRARAP